jgi:hypothetical protein
MSQLRIYKILFLIITFVLINGFIPCLLMASSGASLEVDTIIQVLPPTNLKVIILSGNYAHLSWEDLDPNIIGHYIYRNDVRLTSVSGASYLDQSLSPGVRYNYQISAYDIHGNESELTLPASIKTPLTAIAPGENPLFDKFKFLLDSDKVSIDSPFLGDYGQPDDVVNLSLNAQNKNILISWSNPRDFANVYIVRSPKFYPESRFSGLPLWQGRTVDYLDKDVEFDKNYYYGIFVCKENNICSPGAYVVARLGQKGDLLLTSTTTLNLAKRTCDKKVLETNKSFFVSLSDHLPFREVRLHILRLTQSNKTLAIYKMSDDGKGNFLTSDLRLTTPGIYYYEIESYDIYGADRKSLSCGEITVTESNSESKSWFKVILPFFKNIF